MVVSDIISATVAAWITVSVFTEVFVYLVKGWRERQYSLQEQTHQVWASAIAAEFASPDEQTDKAFALSGAWSNQQHVTATMSQDKYYASVTRSVTGLALAFFILATDVTILRNQHWFHIYSAIIELLALLYVFIQFVLGMYRSRTWIIARAKAELIRQAGLLEAVAACSNLVSLSEFDRVQWEARIDSTIPRKGRISDIPVRLNSYWNEIHDSLSSTIPSVSERAFAAYLHKRSLRQFRWFESSIDRLNRISGIRVANLRAAYLFCCGLALLKLLMILQIVHAGEFAQSMALLFLMFATAAASAYTAFYISSNQRSLLHRYTSQLRLLSAWFIKARSTAKQFDPVTARELIGEFESLMIGELIDWVHVSSHDTIEISIG